MNYTISIAHYKDGKFRFISSRLMSSKKEKYRKTMAQAFKEIMSDEQARLGFIDRCVEIVASNLIRPKTTNVSSDPNSINAWRD